MAAKRILDKHRKTTTHSIALPFSWTTETKEDWGQVPADIFFYDKKTDQVWKKLSDGSSINIWEYKNYTDEEIDKVKIEIEILKGRLDIIEGDYLTSKDKQELKCFTMAMVIKYG